MFIELVVIFFLSSFFIFTIRNIAKTVGLVDKPSLRKSHNGLIPLVGGISIFTTVLTVLFLHPTFAMKYNIFLICAAILVLFGIIDDKKNTKVNIRLIIQIATSLIIIELGDINLHNLGAIFSQQELVLTPILSKILTVFAIVGAMNAFNMIDGIDGLLGGVTIVVLTALGYLFWFNNNVELYSFCLIMIVALIPYLILNLEFPFGRNLKVFMGDAGSLFIGFSIIWLLLNGTQINSTPSFKPVTALWLIAYPLMDMATMIINRIKDGGSPFKADKKHLHYKFQALGLPNRFTLFILCGFSTICASIGIWSELNNIPESIMLFGFLSLFVVYFFLVSYFSHLSMFFIRLHLISTSTTK
jgi:UDP-GlcNAc:undecaprenyl-phosphate/decaprenyl-phosphate GlcNAc-1-phosphate transferase